MRRLLAKETRMMQLALFASMVLAPVVGFAQSSGSAPPPSTAPSQNAPAANAPAPAPPAPTAPASVPPSTTSATPDSGTMPAPTVTPAAPPGTAPAAPVSDATMPGVKKGSIEDVNAIGNRDIGGRGMRNWDSTESEIKMGKGYSMELEKSTKFITDPVIDEYVNRVGQ